MSTGYIRLAREARFLRVHLAQAGVRVRIAGVDILHEWPGSLRSFHTIPLPLFAAISPSPPADDLYPIQIDFTAADQLTNASLSISFLDAAQSQPSEIPIEIYQRQPLSTSPFYHDVLPNIASPHHSTLSTPAKAVAGSPFAISVTVRDANNNLRTTCDDAVTVIAFHTTTSSSIQFSQSDCTNARYILQPNLTLAGKWLIHAGVNPCLISRLVS